ncbi:Nn.00g111650.m01.CDS01 [Neocucurbitaria sp. VM-36]
MKKEAAHTMDMAHASDDEVKAIVRIMLDMNDIAFLDRARDLGLIMKESTYQHIITVIVVRQEHEEGQETPSSRTLSAGPTGSQSDDGVLNLKRHNSNSLVDLETSRKSSKTNNNGMDAGEIMLNAPTGRNAERIKMDGFSIASLEKSLLSRDGYVRKDGYIVAELVWGKLEDCMHRRVDHKGRLFNSKKVQLGAISHLSDATFRKLTGQSDLRHQADADKDPFDYYNDDGNVDHAALLRYLDSLTEAEFAAFELKQKETNASLDQELKDLKEKIAKMDKLIADKKERLDLLAEISKEMNDDTDTGITAQYKRRLAFFQDFMQFACKQLPDIGEDKSRRMVCVYTKDDQDVWVTFLKRNRLGDEEALQRLRLHTAPCLNSNASNLGLEDIDYSTVSVELGECVSTKNFEERALHAWKYFGGLRHKTRKELEGFLSMKRTRYGKEYAGDSSDASSAHVSEDDSECERVMEEEAKKETQEMTAREALELQQRYMYPKEGEERDPPERFHCSLMKFGLITPDRLVETPDEEDDEDEDDQEEEPNACTIMTPTSRAGTSKPRIPNEPEEAVDSELDFHDWLYGTDSEEDNGDYDGSMAFEPYSGFA